MANVTADGILKSSIPDRRDNLAERYDANIDLILQAAAQVFSEKSFGVATIRDIAAEAGISFSRIYYYLRNKDEILYLISRNAFERLIRLAEQQISNIRDPEEQLKAFIKSHLEYHMSNLAEMKVLVREADSLSGAHTAQIAKLKRDYSRLFRRIVEGVAAKRAATIDAERARIVTSLLFGAMNWFYTWYDPSKDYTRRGRIIDEVYRMALATIVRP
jgi:TetR/AcrR family transcriptional regulator, cholesterol catabolism regulator